MNILKKIIKFFLIILLLNIIYFLINYFNDSYHIKIGFPFLMYDEFYNNGYKHYGIWAKNIIYNIIIYTFIFLVYFLMAPSHGQNETDVG